MRSRLLLVVCALAAGCAQPTLLSCPSDLSPCIDGCFDLAVEPANCGACGNVCPTGMACALGACVPDVCATNNGGCGVDAMCFDMNGAAFCACQPNFHGDGHTCDACTVCDAAHFVGAPCNPQADTVCTACSGACTGDSYESQPCGVVGDRQCMQCTTCNVNEWEAQPCTPGANRACATCTTCAPGAYETAACGPTVDTSCAPCAATCATCAGASDACTSCPPGSTLVGSSCVSNCGNGVVDPGEMCDDANFFDGDGCSSTCAVEAGFYCFGDPMTPSTCRSGSCAFDPATALPLGSAFGLDGAGTASGGGISFSQRSTIYTTANLAYPVMIEADIVYSAPDTTFLGSRGSGLRQPADADEPTDSLRARLSSNVEIAAGLPTIDSTPTPFAPATGRPYHVRWVDDGVTVSITWIDETDLANAITFVSTSSYHGGGDHAFIGGGDMAGLTVANVRACSAPALPITAGLVARYSAIPSWTAVTNATGPAISVAWQDVSGNGHALSENGPDPTFAPGLINGHAALDFGGGARLATAPFALTTDVTVFAVLQHNVPAQWGAIAHHGSRDTDWSMEQSGNNASPDVMHWQTNNDNTNMDLTLAQGSTYVLTGRFAGTARYFSSATFDGAPPTETSIVDASHTIATGSKVLYVGTSDANEASNAYLGDLLYFDRALSDSERDQVIDYLRRLWR